MHLYFFWFPWNDTNDFDLKLNIVNVPCHNHLKTSITMKCVLYCTVVES